jgi:hypothetical protein
MARFAKVIAEEFGRPELTPFQKYSVNCKPLFAEIMGRSKALFAKGAK